MAGRFGTAYLWGTLADTYGRVLVLKTSLYLSTICSIWFGLSTTFAGAVASRFCLGMANALASTTKVLASEIAQGDKAKEEKAMGLSVGMRSWGFLLGPAIGGLLADPLKQYPNWFLVVITGGDDPYDVNDNGFYNNYTHYANRILSTYPFVLPNVVIALICLFSAIACPIFLAETLDGKEEFTIGSLCSILWKEFSNARSTAIAWCPKRIKDEETSLLHIHVARITTQEEPYVWSRIITRQHMISTWIFSFVVTVVDEAFPLFCLSAVGGLGLTETSIGQILSFAGLFFALLQYVVYIQTVQRRGLYSSIELGCFFGLVPAALIPVSLVFDSSNRWRFGFLGVLLGGSKIMTCMCFSSLAIATNKTAPSTQRARMNGIVLLGGSVAKGLGPIFAGLLVAASFSILPYPLGSIAIFGTIGVLGVVAFIAVRRLKHFSDEEP
jgi:MFS family permease